MNTEYPMDGDIDVCKHCGKTIVFQVTGIDDAWTHVDNMPNGVNGKDGVGFCDTTKNFMTAGTWAEPFNQCRKV